jgi:serine/threonine-protein kinase
VLLDKHAHRPEVARRFIEEAQIGGQLQHPGVVPVYDIGRFGNRPFFTMKLVKGQTLAQQLAARADPAQERPRLLGIAVQVCQTLAYAHAKGVIHRDLKPSNVMVGAFGEVQVMDWGLAKVLAEGGLADEERAASRERERPEEMTLIRTARSTGSGVGTDTEAGSLLGTPAYMPPEQANGDVTLLDRRADVFGLGAILCEILTGKPPYVGRSQEEVRRKAANGDLAEARARLEGCGADEELLHLTKACLAPEAVDRPRDAQEVADALQHYLNGVQERLHQAELAHVAEAARAQEAEATAAQERKARAAAQARAVAERQARRLTLALAGTVLLALTLGGGGGLWLKAEHQARQIALTRDVNDALNQATAFRAQARSATVGSVLLFGQARVQAQRASALLESGPADAALKDQVTRLQTELDEEEKDRTLVTALDEASLAQAETLPENRFAIERVVPKFREAFRAYGMAAGEGEPQAAAARIRQRPAAVQEAILAALNEWDDLASRRKLGIAEPHREWLRAVLGAAEPDDFWGRKVRAARRETDSAKRQAALEALAVSADVAKVPVRALTRLASPGRYADWAAIRPPEAVKLRRRAQRHYPADFWVNEHLGILVQKLTPAERDEAVRFLTVAVALRPDSPGARYNLGLALKATGQVGEAIACYQKAIELDRKYAAAHHSLGAARYDQGRVDDAIACYRQAIKLDPKQAETHTNLGIALAAKGQVNEAIACFRKAIGLEPKHAEAHCNLAHVLTSQGRFAEALALFKRGHELGTKQSGWRYPSAAWLRQAERLAALEAKLPAFLKGELKPRDMGEHLGLIDVCRAKKLHHAATRLYADAFATDPKLPNDRQAQRRYRAACQAALAAAGQGKDAAKLDAAAKAKLRGQALDWLRAELTAWSKLLDSGPPQARPIVVQVLSHWQKGPDLAGLRDKAALAKLPPEERAAFARMWADVAALLKKAEERTK